MKRLKIGELFLITYKGAIVHIFYLLYFDVWSFVNIFLFFFVFLDFLLKGGSLGREGKHDVIIPDLNCSKYHLKFEYDMEKRLYFCTDVGSRNGTIMNGKRMSKTKEASEVQRLDHGTYLQIGQTKLLCHIHDGHTTCGQCEPGLVYNDNNDSSNANETVQHKSVHGDVNADHRRQLKNLKKRYGLQDESMI